MVTVVRRRKGAMWRQCQRHLAKMNTENYAKDLHTYEGSMISLIDTYKVRLGNTSDS